MAFWAPDGKSVFATTWRAGRNGVFRIPIDGSPEQLLVPGTVFPAHLSPDRKTFFYLLRGATTRSDIWAMPYVERGLAPGADAAGARPILNSEADELHGQVSPDGNWFTYMSDVTGVAEIYVRRLEPEGRVSTESTRVTTGGGVQPCWSRDGRELFYVSAPKDYREAQMMAVTVRPVSSSSNRFEYGPATPLFKLSMLPIQSVIRDYDVSLDNQRFLVGTAVGDARPSPATILQTWAAALKR